MSSPSTAASKPRSTLATGQRYRSSTSASKSVATPAPARSPSPSQHFIIRASSRSTATSTLSLSSLQKLKQRRDCILKLLSSDSSWISSQKTPDNTSLLNLHITFINPSFDKGNSQLMGSTPNQSISKSSILDDSNTEPSTPILSSPDTIPNLDNLFTKVSYVSNRIASSFKTDISTFRALSGVANAEDNEEHLVSTTCHTREPGAGEVLRSELLPCIMTAEMIRGKKSLGKDLALKSQVISICPRSLRILDFCMDADWLLLTREEAGLQISVNSYGFDAGLAWEDQDGGVSAHMYLDTVLAKM